LETTATLRWTTKTRLALLAANLAAMVLVAFMTPLEQTLGAGLRYVYFHGAWVWAALITFGLAAIVGVVGLITSKGEWPAWSLALGRTGIIFWLINLPMSLLSMQIFWGGLFLDEPRWRVPFAFAVVGVLFQAGLLLVDSPRLACAGNLVYAAALYWSLSHAQNVLHPDSPVFTSDSLPLKTYFVILAVLSLLFSLQIASFFKDRSTS
jgi:hypothetical protein